MKTIRKCQSMQKRISYKTAISDFWNFENFENFEIFSTFFFYFFKKYPQISKFSKNRNICTRRDSKECMYQVSSNSLHKCGFYSTLNVKKWLLFRAFGRNTMHFHIFILFRFLCNKRCSKVIFRVLDEKPTHKHVLWRQMTEIGNLTSWPQMTLTSEKVTSG